MFRCRIIFRISCHSPTEHEKWSVRGQLHCTTPHSPHVRKDHGFRRNEVPIKLAVRCGRVRNAERDGRQPSENLGENRVHVWEFGAVTEEWQTGWADHRIKLCLCTDLDIRVQSHGVDERVECCYTLKRAIEIDTGKAY